MYNCLYLYVYMYININVYVIYLYTIHHVRSHILYQHPTADS